MDKEEIGQSTATVKIPTLDQVSAGGVAFRLSKKSVPEVAIVSVLPKRRWQLPKGIVDKGESSEDAALREVREEAGIETKLLASIETIEYWYVGERQGQRVRYHKFVHFFLLAYQGGDVSNHDHEVVEARWVGIDEAIEMLAFKSERAVVEKAREMILQPSAKDESSKTRLI
jgi:8-oxo-dGTP pyrophosphatase MutT (NUDIX family)